MKPTKRFLNSFNSALQTRVVLGALICQNHFIHKTFVLSATGQVLTKFAGHVQIVTTVCQHFFIFYRQRHWILTDLLSG